MTRFIKTPLHANAKPIQLSATGPPRGGPGRFAPGEVTERTLRYFARQRIVRENGGDPERQ